MTGSDLRAAREATGLTQAAFAPLVPATQADISRWESGAHRIPRWRDAEIRAALAKAKRKK